MEKFILTADDLAAMLGVDISNLKSSKIKPSV